MTIAELTAALETEFGQNFPVFFHHAFIEEGEEIPAAYIVTDSTGVNPFRADNINYYTSYINTVSLYTAIFNQTLMNKVEKVLKDNNIPFDRNTDFDPETLLYETVYSIELN